MNIVPMNDLQRGAMAWYCARTQPKHEHIAAGSIRTRLGLEVFNPRLRMERATRRGAVRVIEPLFPCYVFVRCDLAQHMDAVRHAYGISSLVHFGDRIPAVAEETVEELRACFESDEPMGVQERFKPGTEVLVAAGAFMGSRAVVVKDLPARERVQVLLEFLGRTTLAEVDRKSVSVEDRRLAEFIPALASARLLNHAVAA